MHHYLQTTGPNHNGHQRLDTIKAYLANDPNFIKALWILTSVVREKKGTPDLQDENLMMRGSTLVLADPLS